MLGVTRAGVKRGRCKKKADKVEAYLFEEIRCGNINNDKTNNTHHLKHKGKI